MSRTSETRPADDLQAVIDWMVDGGQPTSRPRDIVGDMCERLQACGLPLNRVAVFVRTLHPDVLGQRFLWRPGHEVEVLEAPHSFRETDTFQHSPVLLVFGRGEAVRRRIESADCPNDFAIIAELREEGVTDYFAQPLTFTNGDVHMVSWTTRRPGGFSDGDISAFEALRAPLSRLAEIYVLRRTAATLLNTYVGRGAGERILQGRIRRGDTEAIDAVVLLSDLRGFSRLSNERPGAEVIGLLNAYFDCLVPPIVSRGGEILKYLGDGLLAIFPVSTGIEVGETCQRALDAVSEAQLGLARYNTEYAATGNPALRHGVGLHIGEVLYGNIGGAGRLDFTAIGPVVNLAARLETLTLETGRDALVSADFARHCPRAVEPIGRFDVAGFSETQEVFALRLEPV